MWFLVIKCGVLCHLLLLFWLVAGVNSFRWSATSSGIWGDAAKRIVRPGQEAATYSSRIREGATLSKESTRLTWSYTYTYWCTCQHGAKQNYSTDNISCGQCRPTALSSISPQFVGASSRFVDCSQCLGQRNNPKVDNFARLCLKKYSEHSRFGMVWKGLLNQGCEPFVSTTSPYLALIFTIYTTVPTLFIKVTLTHTNRPLVYDCMRFSICRSLSPVLGVVLVIPTWWVNLGVDA